MLAAAGQPWGRWPPLCLGCFAGALARQCFQVLDRLLSAVRGLFVVLLLARVFLVFLGVLLRGEMCVGFAGSRGGLRGGVPKQLRVKARQ